MITLGAGAVFPSIAVWGSGTLRLGDQQGGCDWQMVVVYRDLHCSVCKAYLASPQVM
jgi:hypothetical protein